MLYKYNVEHWLDSNVFHTLNFICDAENSEHAIEQCIDHYKSYNKDITICRTYIIK